MRTETLQLRTTTIRRDEDAPSIARRAVLDALDSDHPRRDDTVLLTSELVTNVVRHAPPTVVELDLGVTADPVVVSVTQTGGFPERIGSVGSVGGMGLRIVDAVSTCWGFTTDGATLQLWFQL